MGKLKPGASYIYERVGDAVYRRESGSLDREIVGYDYCNEQMLPPTLQKMRDDQLWHDIRNAAKTNPALQSELDRVIMFYNLLLEHSTNSVTHHPV